MTAAQKRVAIAKDVIQQIKAEKFIALTGRYFKQCQLPEKVNQKTLLEHTEPCDVCAKGAIFLSAIRKFNDYDAPSSTTREYEMERKSCEFFTYKQCDKIELVFEGWESGYETWRRIKTPNLRLIAIMRNIIKNNGTFKP